MTKHLCLVVGLYLAAASCPPEEVPSLTFQLYDNAALAHTPALQGLTLPAQLSLEEQDPEGGEAACHLSGELSGTVGFVQAGVYEFDCRFVATSTGWVWIDGHLVCGDQNAYRPVRSDNPLFIDRPLPFRAHITSNDTSCQSPASLQVFWRKVSEEETDYQLLEDSEDVTLSPCLPPAEAKRDAFQRTLGYGWGAWLRHNMISVVKLPEGLVLTPKLCQTISNTTNTTCLEFATPESDEIRVGLHALDRSYVTYHMAYRGANVTVEYSVLDQDRVYFLITPVHLPDDADYEIQLSGRYAWYRPGQVSISKREVGAPQLIFTTPGLGTVNVTVTNTQDRDDSAVAAESRRLGSDDDDFIRIPLTRPDQPIGFGASIPSSLRTKDVAETIQANSLAEKTRIRNKFGEAKHSVAEAIQSTVMWTLIFNPVENQGLLLPVSRVEFWSFAEQSGAATTDWTYVIFDWDNIFASLLAGLDNKDIAYSNLFQVIKSKTAAGFVPNYSTGGYKSQDRTEPPIGAKVMLELFRKFNDTWAVQVVFDDLLDWNDWFLRRRILKPAGLVALGSHAESFGGPKQQRQSKPLADEDMFAAALESGMDNSPMYDYDCYDKESHLMQLYDVGMSSLFAQEAYSLAELADAIRRPATLGKKLRARGDAMRNKIRTELWDPNQQVFANRYPNGTFSNRISPTSFYPLLTGAASQEQTEAMVHGWLLNASRFCISPKGNFDGNDPNGCYWGLPSISADDPAYMAGTNHYWRGLTWGPSAQIVYWSLREASTASQQADLTLARQALCKQMEELLMSQWNAHRHICENYHPSLNGSADCTGTKFYHWGALTGLIGMIEDGYW